VGPGKGGACVMAGEKECLPNSAQTKELYILVEADTSVFVISPISSRKSILQKTFYPRYGKDRPETNQAPGRPESRKTGSPMKDESMHESNKRKRPGKIG